VQPACPGELVARGRGRQIGRDRVVGRGGERLVAGEIVGAEDEEDDGACGDKDRPSAGGRTEGSRDVNLNWMDGGRTPRRGGTRRRLGKQRVR
jgi:hypothetical protein